MEKKNFLQDVMDDIYKKAWGNHDQKLREYLKKNLAVLGYTFETDQELNEFAKNRIRMLSYPNQKHELILTSDNGKDILIGIFSTKVDLQFEGNKVNIKIG